MRPTPERRRLRIGGVVQGVGFRPFVHGLAGRHGLGGFVFNDDAGVVIEAEGAPAELEAFRAALADEAPALAHVESMSCDHLAALGDVGFAIAPSRRRAAGAPALVPPDVATCDACLAELFDPANRRHRHPFVTCTTCGPRFTIVTSAPYDRARTTMAGFAMCSRCRVEYEDPCDRRFHAETICCPDCGPRLSTPLGEAVAVLAAGGVVAVKGLGGYHLACRAGDEAAVARLRHLKGRDEKPFAVMSADPVALAVLEPVEKELLYSRERPIVLVRRRSQAAVAPSVAPGERWLGVMLPYTPLHHLLLTDSDGPLVMTSANRSEEPIVHQDGDDARRRLADLADLVLTHDRPIHRRCEDSVVRADFTVRRSRGHVPGSIGLPIPAERPLVAVGAELNSTFCVARGGEAFISGHLGDLDNAAASRDFAADLALYLDMLGVRPDVVAHDLHPGYRSTIWAEEQAAELVGIQHHHAHAAACLAEHGEDAPTLALVFDGTGYGEDGTLWGGELLRFDLSGYERLGHLEPVPLPGGEAAIREPWRMAAAYLERAERPVPWERWALVRQSLRVNAPLSSGAGRLLDAVAALLGVATRATYEGQPAIVLERLAGEALADPYPCSVESGLMVGADLVRAAHDDLEAGRPRDQIAAAVHEGLAAAAAAACAAVGEPHDTVVLSGGCFQNLRLLASTRRRLEALGFRVLSHRLVPPGDGGISYGQAAIAARRTATCA